MKDPSASPAAGAVRLEVRSPAIAELSALAESVGLVLWEADPATSSLTFVGEGITHLLGCGPAEWLDDRSRATLVHPDDRSWVLEHWNRQRARGGGDSVIDYRAIARDGRTLRLRESSRLVSRDGLPQLICGALAEVAEASVAPGAAPGRSAGVPEGERLGRFVSEAGRIAHELNNMLTALLGFTEVMALEAAGTGTEKPVDDVRESAAAVARLTARLRALVDAERPASAAGAGTGTGGDPRVVLLAEDEPIVRRILVQTLRREGWTVLEASSGAEALRSAREFSSAPDLLVTDILMPGMSGPELAEALRRDWPDLPVLFVTGFAEEADPQGLPAAPVGILFKPFTPSAIVARARGLLAERSR